MLSLGDGISHFILFLHNKMFFLKKKKKKEKKALSLPSSEEFSEKRTALARAKLFSLELTYSWQTKPFFFIKEIQVFLALEELKDFLRSPLGPRYL